MRRFPVNRPPDHPDDRWGGPSADSPAPPRGSPPQPGPAALAVLAQLTHHRWALPALGLCERAENHGLKHVTFLHRLGVSRDSLGRTLQALLAGGWMAHNPGPGHPLRPEYVLTAAGKRIAPHARRIVDSLRRLDAQDRGLNKWALPVLAALASSPARRARFSDLARVLNAGERAGASGAPGASARALALALRELEDEGLIERRVLDTYPPTSRYALTRRSLRLAAAAHALAIDAGVRLPASPNDSAPAPRAQARQHARTA